MSRISGATADRRGARQSVDGKPPTSRCICRATRVRRWPTNRSAVQDVVASVAPPPGVHVYVTGPSALSADQHIAGDRSVKMIEILTFTVIIVMLLLVYRSFVTVLLVLLMVVLELSAARGIVAFLGSTTSSSAVDVRHQPAGDAGDRGVHGLRHLPDRPVPEARSRGMDRETACYDMFHGTAHVILGSGLTIAGATLCLHFTRLPHFQSLGIPLAVGMVTVVIAAPDHGSRGGLDRQPVPQDAGTRHADSRLAQGGHRGGPLAGAHPGRHHRTVADRAADAAGYQTNFNDRNYCPRICPPRRAIRLRSGTSVARMNPELLMIESDHDLRNSADFLVINKITKGDHGHPRNFPGPVDHRPRERPWSTARFPSCWA